ncbi:VOC family protein [Streptomyces sp. NPDC020571]|uniref:VOC family protein n=1 Tax=Streptomyces sp. NPDC020571 TaxID=3365079 RepID=UPI0037A55449
MRGVTRSGADGGNGVCVWGGSDRLKHAISNRRHVVGRHARSAGPQRFGEVLRRAPRLAGRARRAGNSHCGCLTARTVLRFQQAEGYRAPVWPPADGDQRPMMHFDFQVGDLDSAVAEAVALGATIAEFQPRENVRVLFDPAGHPFCLCRDDE